ncbi:hypothetical protein [Actimicrobium antarcticum]|uniref:Uncharacterized protein n=1 Tax=Actimicrobium antarcticum TaxID=1051899 RepID=A0ABP7TRQ9_9BURK
MPQEIEHIDAIARQSGRDALYVIFHDDLRQRLDWAALPVRQQIITWLDLNGMHWRPCGHVGSTTFFGRYLGEIYIDVPFDLANPDYMTLCAFLENPDGSCKFPGARFCYYTLAEAMKNAEHDAPGFWEKVWEDF